MKKGIFVVLLSLLLLPLAGCRRSYTVIFDPNGGQIVSGEAVQTVPKGTSASAPVVQYDGYSLEWDKDFSNVMEDMTVTAQWTRIEMDSADLASYVQERTVTVTVDTINGYENAGTGFFIDDQGTILTNYHVIDMGASISVQTQDSGSYDVDKVVDFSPVYDLAILKIDITNNPYLSFSDDEARTGEKVYAVGSALGTLTGSFTEGTVSSTSRTVGPIDCIQMDAAISHGNSGGPVVNSYGDVVGISTYSYSEGENLNLAIKPSMLEQLSMDKNYSVNEFQEWYIKESSRSFSPFDGSSYYYSLVNTYQTVTGASCLLSYDEEGNASTGYHDCCAYYVYDYNADQYDRYVDYLKENGFTFQSSENFSDGISYYYLNEKDGILMDLFVSSDNLQLLILPSI